MEAKNEILERIYKQAKAKRIVLSMAEYAKKLDVSRAQLYKLLKNPEDITQDIMNRALALNYETKDVYNVVAEFQEKYIKVLEEKTELQKQLLQSKEKEVELAKQLLQEKGKDNGESGNSLKRAK